MSDEKILTKAVALAYLQDNYSVDLSEFTQIEETAAALFAKHRGTLDLTGLKTISDKAAQALAVHNGRILLEGVTSISDDAIFALAKGEISHGGYGRTMSVPEEIPKTVKDFVISQMLAVDDESGLGYLNGPRLGAPLFGGLSIQQAELLSSYEGIKVNLNGWYSVDSIDVLKALSEGDFKEIEIRIEEVTSEIASVLATFQADLLGIQSESIDEEAAEKLLAYPHELKVSLKSLPEEVREILYRHHSIANWGSVSDPTVVGTCKICGARKEFTLRRSESSDGFETLDECLQREDWQYDPETVCDSCKDG